MNGGGGESTGGSGPRPNEFDVPTVLARLEADDPETRREAVATVRSVVDETPAVCAPTIPKLRALLADGGFDDEGDSSRERDSEPASEQEREDERESEGGDEGEGHDGNHGRDRDRTRGGDSDRDRTRNPDPVDCQRDIVYCLAELAAESPTDVAPSTPEIVAFAASSHPSELATEAFRCLERVADACPNAVVDHADPLIETLEDDLDPRGLALLARLSSVDPEELEAATGVFREALEADPDRYAATACDGLSDVVCAESRDSSEAGSEGDAAVDSGSELEHELELHPDRTLDLEFVDTLVAVARDPENEPRTRATARECLGDLVDCRPPIETAFPVVSAVLEEGEPSSSSSSSSESKPA